LEKVVARSGNISGREATERVVERTSVKDGQNHIRKRITIRVEITSVEVLEIET